MRRVFVYLAIVFPLRDAAGVPGVALAYGIAQVIDLGVETHLRAGTLEPILTDWPDETFPLYVYYPSRAHVR